MALVLNYTSKVRQALKAPASVGVDVLLLVGIAGLIAAAALMFGQASAPMSRPVHIDLSLWALPKYTVMSLSRGVAAYVISLIFTLIYGTIAAHNHTAEKVMIPALDILQSIPVLAFLPAFVVALITLFPSRRLGLELACVLMIFTAQVWNMTFSFHGSLRSIPTALREGSALQGLSGWQIFRLLEVPAAMIGLVWNSMMSMAGGWFFLSVNEAFQLKTTDGIHDYRLPGIGSYMFEACDKGNIPAQIGAVVAMTIMIIAVDQIIWRPIVVWSQRFKLEDSSSADAPQSWVLNLFQHSALLNIAKHLVHRSRKQDADLPVKTTHTVNPAAAAWLQTIRRVVIPMSLVALSAMAMIGAYKLVVLFTKLPLHDHTLGRPWNERQDWLTVMLALGASFLRTSASVIIGMIWTLPVGILIGLSPRWSNRLQPVTQVLASFPAPMLFPIVYFALSATHIPFGIGCVTLMLLGSQWYILFNVVAGAMAIPAELKEAARVNNLSRWEKWRRLYVPSVFPYLVTGLVTAAGGAWNATIVAEYMTVKNGSVIAFGLGSMINQSQANGQYALLAASVVAMSLFVVFLNRLIWKRLYRLAESRYSLNN